ncbi:MAG: restriction endonuclease subunit S [Christensenella sp.]|uniref:restriction endonuclease subunit S n=1 Tax=Christensenella sp. TaxID=1935934 RepID=UPI002B1EA100|nr:restriction endonuclease subunit S [Christensenella sp.]MEA5004518.1 restriction endonuclease subunit S [Christensenella sp.]
MGKWEYIQFNDAIDDVTKYATKIKKEEYLNQGDYQIIDQGKDSIGGYVCSPDGLYEDVPVIVFGDHTRVFKYVESPLFIGADGVKLLKVKHNDLNVRFVYYYFKSRRVIDTGYNRHFKWLKEFEIPLPPILVQQQIADVLDRASALIEKRKAQIEKLDLLAKSQFIEMFGDPVTNPKGWDIRRLSEIATSRLGKMLDTKQQTGNYRYPYLANFNVQWFRFDFSELNEMDFNEADRQEFELKKGDLLVCEGGEVGRCAIWEEEVKECYFQKALHRIRCNKEIIIPKYLSRWFQFRSQYNKFEDIVGQATIAHLPGVKLKKLQIMVPPIYIQNQFADFIRQIEKQQSLLQQSLTQLKQNYKSLMQKCFWGEIF